MATTTNQRGSNGKHSKPAAPPKQRPVHEIRLGRIKAAIWENDTEQGVRHNVTLSRIYFVDGQWKQSDSFGRDDLPLLQKVADLAHTWIYLEAPRQDAQETSAEEVPY